MKLKLGALKIVVDDRITKADLYKFRGFIGRTFQDPAFHNHNGDSLVYQYPQVQYKRLGRSIVVVGNAEKVSRLLDLTVVDLDRVLRVLRKELVVWEEDVSVSPEMHRYIFCTPWLALNEENYERYKQSGNKQLLESILVGNILSFGKGFGIWFDQKVECRILYTRKVWQEYKGVKLLGFLGEFETNVSLPSWIGLGRKVAFGFGTIRLKGKKYLFEPEPEAARLART